MTKTDDPVSQRHETLGTERIYQHLRNQNLDVEILTHDRNLSINKYIHEKCESVNQKSNLLWKKISTGPDISWRENQVISTWWWSGASVGNCDEIASRLQVIILNTLEHYKNIHSNCYSSSRYKKKRSELRKIRKVITDPKAEKSLLGVIKSSRTCYQASSG